MRVGVIGCGSMGRNHVRVLSAMREVEEIVVYDPNQARVNEMIDCYGCFSYSSVGQLLESVAAVVIAAPTSEHKKLLEFARHRSIPALCEKPLYADESEIDGDEALWPAVGYIERFNPAWQAFARICVVERPFHYAVERLSPWTERSQDVSVVLDLMSHDLACLMSICGPPENVRARGMFTKSAAFDHVMALLEWPDGTVASMTASKASQIKVRRITATCPCSVVEADLLRRSVSVHRLGASLPYEYGGVTQQSSETVISVPQVEPLRAELEDFLEAARGKHPPLVTAATASVVQLVAGAIEDQIRHMW